MVSTAPYTVRARLFLDSDRLLFANGRTSWSKVVTLAGHGHTTVQPVIVQSRTPGLFAVDVTLRAPAGTLLIASGQVSVRSSATSIVGIILTAAALVVLAAWWIRTSLRRRRQRRTDEAGLAP